MTLSPDQSDPTCLWGERDADGLGGCLDGATTRPGVSVADVFQNAEALLAEGSLVVTDIAGVGFEPTTSGL